MSKYFCVCGATFNKKIKADEHAIDFNDASDQKYHIIITKLWRARLRDIIFSPFFIKFLRLSGLYIIYFVFQHHFKIDLNVWESIFIGIGIGLLIG